MKKRAVRGSVAFFPHALEHSGVERVLSLMTLNLEEYDAYIFTYKHCMMEYPYRGTLVDLGFPLYGKNAKAEVRDMLRCAHRVRRMKRELGIASCISLSEKPNLINVLSGPSTAVVSVHENKSLKLGFAGVKTPLVRLLIRTLYNRAYAVVAISKGIAHDLIHTFGVDPRKVRVIYNPCDGEGIRRMAEEEIEEEFRGIFEKPVIINAGRLSRQKGQWYLIRSFQRVRERCRDAQLVFLGDGRNDEAYLRGMVRELGMEGEVHFLGFRQNPFKYMARAQLFALPSVWEGLSMVLLESMACGIPAVSADCKSGPREVLAPDTDILQEAEEIEYARYGVLVPSFEGSYKKARDPLTREEELLAGALVELLGNGELREAYRQRGYRRITDFSMETFVTQWNGLLEPMQKRS